MYEALAYHAAIVDIMYEFLFMYIYPLKYPLFEMIFIRQSKD